MHRHPERSQAESKDPVEVTFKVLGRDPSTSLGMTVAMTKEFYGSES
jgi:hypothetical protein